MALINKTFAEVGTQPPQDGSWGAWGQQAPAQQQIRRGGFGGGQTIEGIVRTLRDILDLIMPLLMVAAFAVFLWGVVKFITAGGDEEKRKSAKNLLIYGLIGLFVMVAVWGITNLVAETFNIQTGGTVPAPSFRVD